LALIAGLAKASEIALKEETDLIFHMLKHKLRLLIGIRNSFTESVVLKDNQRDKPLTTWKDKLELILKFNGPSKSNDADFVLEDIKVLRSILADTNNDNKHDIVLYQLPNTLSISFKDISASNLIENLSNKVACSAGSACHSDVHELSSVLKAMNIDPIWGLGTLRLSWGRHTTEEEIEKAITSIAKEVKKLKKLPNDEPKLSTDAFPWG